MGFVRDVEGLEGLEGFDKGSDYCWGTVGDNLGSKSSSEMV